MTIPTHFDLVWMQVLGGGTEVIHPDIPADKAMFTLQVEQAKAIHGDYGPGSIVFLRPVGDLFAAVAAEVQRAGELHPPLNSAHEAYSVILEELDEFWIEVKKKSSERDPITMRDELIQIAAMAVRTIENLGL